MQKYFSVKLIVISALLAALSIVFGKVLSFTIINSNRISLENLPIIMSGYMFGPVAGILVGVTADIIGCLIVGYTINPFITAGAAAIGLISGIVPIIFKNRKTTLKVFLSVVLSHLVGSLIIKTYGLYYMYNTAPEVLVFRLPVYIGISVVEFLIMRLLVTNRNFISLFKIKNN